MSPGPYDAVVFDNDGVLTHPTDGALLRRATEAAFEAVGVADPPADHVAAVDNDPDALADVQTAYDFDADTFWTHHEREKIARQTAALDDGRKPLYDDVEAIRDLPVPLGLVSNNQHATVEHVVERFDLGDVFETVYGRRPTIEGYRQGKPNPHYLERALDDLGTTEVLYVGDSDVDVQAAARAGVDAAFVRRPHREGYDLPAEPTYRIDGLHDLRALVAEGSPSRP